MKLNDIISKFDECFLTHEDLENLSDGEAIVPGVVMETHIIALVAKPGVGKSAVLRHLAAKMVRDGYIVQYMDVDSSASQVKAHGKQLLDAGVDYAAPQVKADVGIEHLIDGMKAMPEIDEDRSKLVIIMDTTKKFVNMIGKSELKEFFLMLRNVGCTVLLAAHANKHLDEDNKIIYEGTGDLESDCDEMLLLYADKDEEHLTQTISAYPKKSRSTEIKKQSWQLDLNTMQVTDIEFVDLFEKEDDAPETKERPLPEGQRLTLNVMLALQALDSSRTIISYKKARQSWHDKDNPDKGRWDSHIRHLREKGYIKWEKNHTYIQLTGKALSTTENN